MHAEFDDQAPNKVLRLIVTAAKLIRIERELVRRGGLGLKRSGHDLVGACPQCGGRDRFAVNTTKQVWLCRGCGRGGDAIAFVQHVDGVDFRTAVRLLSGDISLEMGDRKSETAIITPLGHRPIEFVHQSAIDRQNTKRALQIWNGAVPIRGTLAEQYLHGRGLHDLPGDDVLRFHAACRFGKNRTACLLALYRDIATNEPRAIARTAISASGTKIGRMMLGPVKGAAIKVDDNIDVEQGLVVGEGLETILAGRQLGFRPAWALGSAGAIRTFPVLAGIEALTILVDNDPADQRGRRAGDEAATECWCRWSGAGREVRAFTTDKMGTDIANVIEGANHG